MLQVPAAKAAVVSDAAMCQLAIDAVEPSWHLPPDLLRAIGVVESGRLDPASRSVRPWPWSIDIEGTGHIYATAAEAIAAVRLAQSAGIRSIDVGCMQINLEQHPDAFARLEDAFDPTRNVLYAVRFLTSLRATTGNWASAVAAYHSRTPALAQTYLSQVVGVWPAAAAYGVIVQAVSAAPPVRDGAAVANQVDPDHSLTPAFRARLIASAVFDSHREEPALLVKPGALLIPPSSVLLEPTPHPISSHRRKPERQRWLEAELNQGRSEPTNEPLAEPR
jgi:hypothetical protein